MAANVSGTLLPTRSALMRGVAVDLTSSNYRRRHCKFTCDFHIHRSSSCFRQTAVARGDLTQQITGVSVSGEMLSLVNTINDMIAQLAIFAKEVKKVAFEVGTEGKLGVQAEVGNVQGIWQEITCVPMSPMIHFIILIDRLLVMQNVCQHHGRKLDYASAWIRPDLGGSYGRRFHSVHHGRGERRNGFIEDPDQPDGVQLA